MKHKKAIIIIVISLVVIGLIIGIVVYMHSKNKRSQSDLLTQINVLKQQLTNPSLNPAQQQDLNAQIAALTIQSNQVDTQNPLVSVLNPSAQPIVQVNPQTTTTTAQVDPAMFPLHTGSITGKAANSPVMLLQAAINKKCKPSPLLVLDGNFGTKTETALRNCSKNTTVSYTDYLSLIS